MSSKLTSSKPYKNLINSIKSASKTGFLAAQKALEYQRLKTYWQIGRQITRFASTEKIKKWGTVMCPRYYS